MHKANEEHADGSEESKERFSSDVEALKTSFTQLREDMTNLVSNTLGTSKSGAEALKDRAADAAGDLKHRVVDAAGELKHRVSDVAGELKHRVSDAADDIKDRVNQGKERVHESLDKLGNKIKERPLTSAAIALGIGFLLARLLHPKR